MDLRSVVDVNQLILDKSAILHPSPVNITYSIIHILISAVIFFFFSHKCSHSNHNITHWGFFCSVCWHFLSPSSELAVLDKDLSSAKALYEQMQKEGTIVDELSLKRLAVLYRNEGETVPFPEPPVSHTHSSAILIGYSLQTWISIGIILDT